MNTSLHAIGGQGVEDVSDHTIKSKGIVKIQRNDGSIGTAVLFNEGKGFLGLSAKHVFDNFDAKTNPIIAYLGTEKRNVVKVYYPSNKTDMVVFVLQTPFEGVNEFPRLPETSSATTSTYAGRIYGYGGTTASNNHTPIADSSGKCRTGKVIAADFHQLDGKARQLLNIDKDNKITDFSLNNLMFSFTLFQNSEVLDNNKGSEEAYRFNETLLKKRYLSMENNNSSPNQLLSSPCFTFYGDSGGPLISDDNQLYAIAHRGYFLFQGGIYFELSENIQNLNGFEIKFGEDKLKIGFDTEDSAKLYVEFPSQVVRNSLQTKVHQFLNENISDYFMKKSVFFENLLQQKQGVYFANWLTRYHLYNSNYFISIVRQKSWIERVMPLAFKYITETLQS